MLCQDCKLKTNCITLCQAAEAYVNQDYVLQREIPLSMLGAKRCRYITQISNTYLTPMQRKIVTLLGQGLTRQEVCQLLDISRPSLRIHLLRIKSKL